MEGRKLQTEIDRTLKKVGEGVECFENVYGKIQASKNQAQKEQLEMDLKAQIKRLQRMRDQIKTWVASNDIKSDKSSLIDNRKLIETQMMKYKAYQKEIETKAFSKEGLTQAAKFGPNKQQRGEVTSWFQTKVEELQMQVEQTEAEIESLQGTTKTRGKSNSTAWRLKELAHLCERHAWHISRLGTVLRLLSNGSLPTEKAVALKEDVAYYVESNTEDDFEENEGIYDELNLKEEEEIFRGLVYGDSDEPDGDGEHPTCDTDVSPAISPSTMSTSAIQDTLRFVVIGGTTETTRRAAIISLASDGFTDQRTLCYLDRTTRRSATACTFYCIRPEPDELFRLKDAVSESFRRNNDSRRLARRRSLPLPMLMRVMRRGSDPASSLVRAKSACYACGIRQKECDERPCLQCLTRRMGPKLPEWLRVTGNVTELRDKIKSFLASQGMIKGHSGSGPRAPEQEPPTLHSDIQAHGAEDEAFSLRHNQIGRDLHNNTTNDSSTKSDFQNTTTTTNSHSHNDVINIYENCTFSSPPETHGSPSNSHSANPRPENDHRQKRKSRWRRWSVTSFPPVHTVTQVVYHWVCSYLPAMMAHPMGWISQWVPCWSLVATQCQQPWPTWTYGSSP